MSFQKVKLLMELNNYKIRYGKDGFSTRIFDTPKGQIKIHLDRINMIYKFVNALNNLVIFQGGTGVKNMNVLLRNIRRDLKRFAGAELKSEVRPHKQGKRIGATNGKKII